MVDFTCRAYTSASPSHQALSPEYAMSGRDEYKQEYNHSPTYLGSFSALDVALSPSNGARPIGGQI